MSALQSRKWEIRRLNLTLTPSRDALDKTNFSKQTVKIKFLNDVDLRSVTKPKKKLRKINFKILKKIFEKKFAQNEA